MAEKKDMAEQIAEYVSHHYDEIDTWGNSGLLNFIRENFQHQTLYKVRMFVNERCDRGKHKGEINRIEYKEEIIVDNLEHARSMYRGFKNAAESYHFSSKYQGKAELFVPHVHENGLLESWPDNNQYIERYEFPEGE